MSHVATFREMELPRPEALANNDVDERLFQRIAVAYGLSFDKFDMGEITPPDRIGDVPQPRVRQPALYVSKDQV